MFFVPSEEVMLKPGWVKKELFLTDGIDPLLVAYVTSRRKGSASVGFWGFSHPIDLEKLINGISKTNNTYELAKLSVLLPPKNIGVDSITSEVVTEVIADPRDVERRTFIVRTAEGNSYIMGDPTSNRTPPNITIYKLETDCTDLSGSKG
jgi:hypothetical protein